MISQQYHLYSATDHTTWSILYIRQLEAVKNFAYSNFLKGIRMLDFNPQVIPDFDAVNVRLKNITGWAIYGVPGLIDNAYFFEQMHQKKFGATNWMRKPEQIDYLEEPDMFHDVFGHVPLLTDPDICNYLYNLAGLANKYITNATIIEAIARLYWYTIEFGLVREKGALKIYGAGILSSVAETVYCFSDKPELISFDMETIIDTPYIKDDFQQQYFVLNSFADLNDAVGLLEMRFEKEYGLPGNI